MDQALVNISPQHDCRPDPKLLFLLGQGHDQKGSPHKFMKASTQRTFPISVQKYFHFFINALVTEVDTNAQGSFSSVN